MTEDLNQLAHRIVQEATKDERTCPNGHVMEKHEEPLSSDAFGGSRVNATKVYFVCPVCGHDVRSS